MDLTSRLIEKFKTAHDKTEKIIYLEAIIGCAQRVTALGGVYNPKLLNI
ncbi:MAG: hypothetical protein AAF621_04705 [Pseudomonadota bacterium]